MMQEQCLPKVSTQTSTSQARDLSSELVNPDMECEPSTSSMQPSGLQNPSKTEEASSQPSNQLLDIILSLQQQVQDLKKEKSKQDERDDSNNPKKKRASAEDKYTEPAKKSKTKRANEEDMLNRS